MSRIIEPGSAFATYKRLLKMAWRYWPALLIGFAGALSASLVDAFLIAKLKTIIDHFNDYSRTLIRFLPLFIIFIFIIRSCGLFLGNYFIMRAGRNIVRDVRIQLFEQYLALPAWFYDRSSTGHLLSVLLYNVDKLSSACADSMLNIVRDVALALGLLGVMFWLSWQLTLMFLTIAPVIAWVMRQATKRQRHVSTGVQNAVAEMTRVAEQSIQGYRVVRVFGGSDYENQHFHDAANLTRHRELKVNVTNNVNMLVVQVLMAIPIAVAVYFATNPHYAISRGAFASFAVAILSLLRPIRRLTTVNATVQSGVAAAQSIFQMLSHAREPASGTQVLPACRGDIVYRDVSFAYAGTTENVLHRISFTAKPGETVALVGHSGGGKSTLVNLLPRFYDYQAGEILIDGHALPTLSLTSLRSHIALVSQQVELFDDSIYRNIAYGELAHCTPEAVKQALIDANAWSFVEALPAGMDSMIGEDGVLLSGGQRQRLSIARALLKQAPILILDEATSSLDSASEREIQSALTRLMVGRTTLVIAHRLSTIQNADQILVMDAGSIVECGQHQALLQRNGHYARLYALQYGKEGGEPLAAID